MIKRCITATLIFALLSGCHDSSIKKTNGYIEGRYIYIATSDSGILKQLFVEKGRYVKKGQQLFTLETQPESSLYAITAQNLKQAIAARDALVVQLEYEKKSYERYKLLATKKVLQQAELDKQKSIHERVIARIAEANANIEAKRAEFVKNKWAVEQNTGYAPTDAIVFDNYYLVGEYTVAKKPIVSLLAANNIKVIFYIKENDLALMKLNKKITINCDHCSHPYLARVNYISDVAEYTPPILYSGNTNSKLIYRIEAQFLSQEAFDLHPGQPVYVSYNTHV